MFFLLFYKYFLKVCFGNCCRFYPSCSQYAEQALSQLGGFKGAYLILKRLLRCQPFHPGGYDPVPPSIEKEA